MAVCLSMVSITQGPFTRLRRRGLAVVVINCVRLFLLSVRPRFISLRGFFLLLESWCDCSHGITEELSSSPHPLQFHCFISTRGVFAGRCLRVLSPPLAACWRSRPRRGLCCNELSTGNSVSLGALYFRSTVDRSVVKNRNVAFA